MTTKKVSTSEKSERRTGERVADTITPLRFVIKKTLKDTDEEGEIKEKQAKVPVKIKEQP